MIERHSGNSKQNKAPITLRLIQESKPDSFYFIKKIVKTCLQTTKEAYYSLAATFSLDHLSYYDFKRVLTPLMYSGAAYIIGESVTKQMSRYASDSEEYDFAFKFMIGTAILTYSALHRITEKRIKSAAEYQKAVISEILAIVYLYSSTYQGSRKFLDAYFTDENYSLILSLATSTMLIPGVFSFLVKQYQEKSTKKLYAEGAQLSVNATISSGRTPFANTYFQTNYYLLPEISSFSRIFQLGLISDNILNAKTALQQFRNVPAFLIDIFPPTIKKLIKQKKKIDEDYEKNTTKHPVIKFTLNGYTFANVPRSELRTGYLVWCDDKFDVNSAPISGEMYAFVQKENGEFTPQLIEQEFSTNLASKNGEPNWIKLSTQSKWSDEFKQVDLKEVHRRRQPGVLAGTKLNLRGQTNFFIRIKEEKDRAADNNKEKTAIINQIIGEHKRNTVAFAILSSIVTAYFISNNLNSMPVLTLRLLFNVAQMMIAFSESFLREMINSSLMKEINQNLLDCPIENAEAMRIVDLCNILGGDYYKKQCPRGAVFLSDKTGTLTTPKMEVHGIWTRDMRPDVQRILNEEKGLREIILDEVFEFFSYAYTNNSKGEEPEEFSILQLVKEKFSQNDCLTIEEIGNNHFRKTLSTAKIQKTVETMHLGLCRSLGGRLTLVDDDKNKYLVFCGIPKADKFKSMQLFEDYSRMQVRTGILSRDWCIAKIIISEALFDTIKKMFLSNNEGEIEKFISDNPAILAEFIHIGTFIIDNPLKEGVKEFIANCRKINLPLFMATGDNPSAAKNMTKVLCPENAKNIITIQTLEDIKQLKEGNFSDCTIIFVGINDPILEEVDSLMRLDFQDRPVIIFSEMSPVGKGILAKHFKKQGYFVITNGDGTNDVEMMLYSHLAITHPAENGTFAKGVKECSDLSEKQLQKLFQSSKSFYELFDVHLLRSKFLETFSPLAVSQEKSSIAMLLKCSKIGFEAASAMGVSNVIVMPYQHEMGALFDTLWFIIAYFIIKKNTELPMDKNNLTVSYMPLVCMIGSLAVAAVSAFYNYFQSNESTNLTTMLIFLGMFAVVLESLFNRYGAQRDLIRAEIMPEIPEEKSAPLLSKNGMFGMCRRKRSGLIENKVEMKRESLLP